MKNNNLLLSVIIPAYNIAKYIPDCMPSFVVDSVRGKYEVLIINDGAKDNTSELAHEFENKYPDIFRVLDKQNGGHGSVINLGIEEAKGKYYKVVDGDDWIMADAFEALINTLEECNADIVANCFNYVDDASGDKTFQGFDGIEYGKEYDLSKLEIIPPLSLHALTYKTSLLRDNKIRVTEKRFYDDVEYVLYPMVYVKSILFKEEAVYMYRIGNEGQSVGNIGRQKHFPDHEIILSNIVNYYNSLEEGNVKCFARSLAVELIRIHYDTLLSFPVLNREMNKKMLQFNSSLQKNEPQLYAASDNVKSARLVRAMGARCYMLKHFAYRFGLKPYLLIKRCIKGEK